MWQAGSHEEKRPLLVVTCGVGRIASPGSERPFAILLLVRLVCRIMVLPVGN